jgi:hypothetical protein
VSCFLLFTASSWAITGVLPIKTDNKRQKNLNRILNLQTLPLHEEMTASYLNYKKEPFNYFKTVCQENLKKDPD